MTNFCYNCGAQVGNEDVFCPECGCRLKDEEKINTWPLAADKSKDDQSVHANGYILTNLKVLGKKFNCPVDTVRNLLEQYISYRQQCGIDYTLIDVANYSPKQSINKGFFSSNIHLVPSDGWQKHQRLLMDCYFYDREKKNVEYLFIIGSDDVIPMPSVGMHSSCESPILSDFPYSHLYGDKTESMISANTIYQQPQMLFVGRLPLSGDATLSMLQTYLQNACDISISGLNNTCVYGQCDPHWKKVTSFISHELYSSNLFNDYPGLSAQYVYRSLLLTPFVTTDSTEYGIERVFDPEASFYFFNMHGSSHPASNNYYGAEVRLDDKKERFFSGITPKQFLSTNSLNIVVAEPCFGAKPNKKRHDESILLSALVTKTVLFFGSTHVAWGASDPVPQVSSSQNYTPHISSADVMAKEIIYNLLQGVPAGAALWLGRNNNFIKDGMKPTAIDTCLEFNLFGDPSLTIYGISLDDKCTKNTTPYTKNKMYLDESDWIIYPSEQGKTMKVKTAFSNESRSVLSMVRNAVNHNIMEINDKINAYLYKNYNISPKRLNKVLEISYADGEKTYDYYYKDTDMDTDYVVTIDNNNHIKNVISSR